MESSRWVRPLRRRRNLSKSPKVLNRSSSMAEAVTGMAACPPCKSRTFKQYSELFALEDGFGEFWQNGCSLTIPPALLCAAERNGAAHFHHTAKGAIP